MELQKLRTLVILSESTNYTQAAERLYTTQSNVSKHILSLERELGIRLVDRNHRYLALTPAGETVVRYGRRILAEYDMMCRALQADQGQLTLACIPIIAHYGVTKLLSGFQKTFPNIQLCVQEREDRNLPDAVRAGLWELAVCRTDQSCSGLDKLVLYVDHLVAVLPAGHPLAQERCLSLSQLRKEPFLQLGPTSILYQKVLEACHSAGFAPEISYTSTRMENILDLVREGAGISLLMRHAVDYLPTHGGVLCPLQEEIVSELSLVRATAAPLSRTAHCFWSYTQKWIQAN